MAELADALDSGSSRGNSVDVRVILAAMKTVIVAAGHIDPSLAAEISRFEFIVAVDGGLNFLQSHGITPHLIVGDFDSVDPEVLESAKAIEQVRLPIDKDKSDLEIAIELIYETTTEQMIVFGALGLRGDHSHYNLLLLSRYPHHLIYRTEFEEIMAIDHSCSFDTHEGQTISLMPLGSPVHGVTTSDLEWELNNATIDTRFVSLSNRAKGDRLSIEMKSGLLLIYRSRTEV